MKHLSAIMKVLEFLAWKSSEVKDYRIYLDRMLWLCSKPPLLERTSESLVSSAIMEHYFTLLGYLLAIVSREEEILRIHDALDCLLIGRARPATNVAAVKLDFRRCSMENSRLPITIVELLRGATLGVYPQVLQVAFTLTSVSHKCCKWLYYQECTNIDRTFIEFKLSSVLNIYELEWIFFDKIFLIPH